ncbi:MAG: pseudouridine synthase [Pseudobdellovibrionaceae bacterium]
MSSLKVIFQNENWIAIDKPSGFYVHPPEDGRRIDRSQICLYILRDQIGKYLYPVHRLDVPTSGILIYALSSRSASKLCGLFSSQKIRKKYWAVARGLVPEDGQIDMPLPNNPTSENLYDARTDFRRLSDLHIAEPVGKKFPFAKYSLIEAAPQTGRYHQIRRHFARKSHPLLGDGDHGDSHHNRYFREKLGVQGLCLRAHQVEFQDPITEEMIQLKAGSDEKWRKIGSLFNYSFENQASLPYEAGLLL